MNDLSLSVVPKDQPSWDSKHESQIMFDKQEIMVSIPNLQFVGNGRITDPDTNIVETINLKADLE